MADPRARFVITAENKASRVLKSIGRDTSALNKKFATMGGLLASFATVRLGQGFVGILRQTEVLNASLKTATGSTEAAAGAFKQLEEFAARTPFALEQSVEAFVKLKNLGLDPSIAALESYGNTAAAMGKDLNQMIEAVADAATGEFERLKEFGIKAKSQGDQVSLTFRGVTKTIGKNAKEIEGYLRDIGEVEFAGAMEERAMTLDGALSNLGDSFAGLARAIGDAGVTELISDAARAMTDLANAIPGTITALGGRFKEGFDNKSLEQVNARIAVLKDSLVDLRRISEKGAMDPGYFKDFVRLESELSALENRRKRLQNPNFAQDILLGPLLDDAPVPKTGGGSDKPPPKTKGLSEAQKELNRLLAEGRSLTESLYTPQEAYAAQIERLNKLVSVGSINQETYNRAVFEYQDQLDEATGKTQKFADLQAVIAEIDPVAPLLEAD